MPNLLTIYSWPKSFADPHIATIQRNATRSWLLLEPKPNILVFGDEDGIDRHCSEFGLTRGLGTAEVVDNTVRIRDLATLAERNSDSEFYCFINADIILTGGFIESIQQASRLSGPFLMGASPWNVSITEDFAFGPNWELELSDRARAEDDCRPPHSCDWFVYRKGGLRSVPDLLVGRWYIDNGLMWFARDNGYALVDATTGALTIHQRHDYRHIGDTSRRPGSQTRGAELNLKAIGGTQGLFTFNNATHQFTAQGLQRYWRGSLSRWSTHPDGPPFARFLNKRIVGTAAALSGPVRRVLGLVNHRRD